MGVHKRDMLELAWWFCINHFGHLLKHQSQQPASMRLARGLHVLSLSVSLNRTFNEVLLHSVTQCLTFPLLPAFKIYTYQTIIDHHVV